MKNISILTFFLFCYLQVNSQNYLHIANACFDTGDYENAKKNYTLFQLHDGSSDISAKIQKINDCFQALIVADGYFKNKEWAKAKNQYKIVLEKNPNDRNAKTYYDLCTAYLNADTGSFFSYTEKRADLNIEMVAVQGGTFTMGCVSERSEDCDDMETPAHQVTVSDFYIGKYEVTQAQWKAIMDNNPSRFKGDNLPVERMKWNDLQEFIRRLNAKTGKHYRLPTEAEWEYAARGGNKSKGYKYSGDNNIDNVAWYEENSGKKTHPVGSKFPNELGIYDMSGNVFEICCDWMGRYTEDAQIDPQGPSSGPNRVVRGGSWFCDAKFERITYRYYYPVSGESTLGFRLACSAK